MKIEDAQTIAILGRQPALGIAELESLYGSEKVSPFGDSACLLAIDSSEIDFHRLGGTVKLCRILSPLSSNRWSEIEKYLIETTPEHAKQIDGKLTFGVSTYGIHVTTQTLARSALAIKKAIKNSGQSVRMVPHTAVALGSAVVLHNKLTKEHNWELVVASDGMHTLLAQTTNVQDIDAYSKRDQARPMRDAKVGMLPPKLAQQLINIATGRPSESSNDVILDPFCGTGVVLQEALLMGYAVHGTDIDQRMVEFSTKNIAWLVDTFHPVQTTRCIEVADATTHQWDDHSFTTVACETFLGKPLSTLPPSDQLSKIIYEANYINHRFLQNIAGQIPTGTRLCLAVPAWRGKREFLHLPLLDHLTDMGYTRVRFKHVSNEDLIYHRDGQVVGRELLVLIKN